MIYVYKNFEKFMVDYFSKIVYDNVNCIIVVS